MFWAETKFTQSSLLHFDPIRKASFILTGLVQIFSRLHIEMIGQRNMCWVLNLSSSLWVGNSRKIIDTKLIAIKMVYFVAFGYISKILAVYEVKQILLFALESHIMPNNSSRHLSKNTLFGWWKLCHMTKSYLRSFCITLFYFNLAPSIFCKYWIQILGGICRASKIFILREVFYYINKSPPPFILVMWHTTITLKRTW